MANDINFKHIEHEIQQSMGKIRNIHFVGIGGIGMSGIAEVLINQGYNVTGSDLLVSPITKKLESLGVIIYYGHNAKNIRNADVLVVSSAINLSNPEIAVAKELRIPIIPRAQMLGELMRFRYGIAISGTHGKTTTTSLISSIIHEAGFDPTFVVGGRINHFNANARLGSGPYIVVEADESDASFLHLKPMISVVTNIDQDHMETYDNDFNKLQTCFQHFLKLLPFYGMAILCIDDQPIKKILDQISCPFIMYGFDKNADFRAINVETNGLLTTFTVLRNAYPPLAIEMQIPGKHNIQNALAAIAVATYLEVKDEHIISALKKFRGVGRRFELHGQYKLAVGNVLLLDDYGHHPNEIASNIKAVRQVWPDKRLVMLFQPHRYTRLQALMDDFATVLQKVDSLFLLDVYSAGEKAIPGINSYKLYELIKQNSEIDIMYIDSQEKCFDIVPKYLRGNDVLVTQGAGSIGSIAQEFASLFDVQG